MSEKVVFVKYGNRKLYDTSRSSYASMTDFFDVAAAGADVQVLSDVDGRDVTLSAACRALYEKVKSLDPATVGLGPGEVFALFARVKETK